MTTIDPTSQLVAIIRQQVASTRNQGIARQAASGDKITSTAGRKPSRELTELVAKRVRAIDPADPRRSGKAFRVFLESVLLGELGMELINDPAFYRLVDDVHCTMESDTELRSQMDRAGQLLLNAQASS